MSFPPHDCEYRSCASSLCYSSYYHKVTAQFNFAKEEEKVLAYWKQIDAFQTSLKLSEGRPEYSFYDGPPFATGLPHYGHLLAGTIKVSFHASSYTFFVPSRLKACSCLSIRSRYHLTDSSPLHALVIFNHF